MVKLDPTKASDIYHIKPIILRDLTPFLTPILTTLFNRAIDENHYPDPLKTTKLIEIYKAKDPTSPSNYRPISLLPIIAKLFDTIINRQLMNHLLKHDIISPTQYAFRPNSNTTLTLQAIIDEISKHKHKNNPILGIYIDLSKAYDTVSHEKLLRKLRDDFHFSTTTVAFFKSYFTNRTQQLHTNHATSTKQTITHGIPQGSTLSTTLFLLYINDITHAAPNSSVYTYADDTSLIITAPTIGALQPLAQSELANLIAYFHWNNLVPNPSKTQYTIFFQPKNTPPLTITIQDTTLEETASAKLLGVIITSDLKFHAHIRLLIRKLQPSIRSFRYANKLLPPQTMKQLYYTHVYPHLINAISIWGSPKRNAHYLQPLIRTHKKIIRLLVNAHPLAHTAPIMADLQLLNLNNLYTLRVNCEMHPFIHPKGPLNRPKHYHHYIPSSHIHEYPTRHAYQGKLFIPAHVYARSGRRAHVATANQRRYSKVWSELPEDLRTIQSVNTFKCKLATYLLKKQGVA